MAGRTSPIFTDDGMVENPQIGSRPSSSRSLPVVDDGSAEMAGYLLEKEEELDALRRVSGQDDVSQVTRITMTVDTNEVSISNLGQHMPKLQELKLNHSIITSIRDLGTGLRNLQVLWLSRVGLERLDGVSSLLVLRELYVSFNNISTLEAMQGCDELEVLDLEGNQIMELSEVDMLGLCWRLQMVNLEGNPIESRPGYRSHVAQAIPHLMALDDRLVTSEEREGLALSSSGAAEGETGAGASGTEEQAALVGSALRSARVGFDSHEFEEVEAAVAEGVDVRPGTAGLRISLAHLRPSTTGRGLAGASTSARAARPASAYRPGSAAPGQQRPQSSAIRSISSQSAGVSRSLVTSGGLFWRKHRLGRPPSAEEADKEDETGSALTQGAATDAVMAGGGAAALRKRRQKATHGVSASVSVTSSSSLRASIGAEELSIDQMLEELRAWKIETTELALREEDRASMPTPALDSDDEAAFAGGAEGVELFTLGDSDSDGDHDAQGEADLQSEGEIKGEGVSSTVNPLLSAAAPPTPDLSAEPPSPMTPRGNRSSKHREAIRLAREQEERERQGQGRLGPPPGPLLQLDVSASPVGNPLFEGEEGDNVSPTSPKRTSDPLLTASMELLGQSQSLRRSISAGRSLHDSTAAGRAASHAAAESAEETMRRRSRSAGGPATTPTSIGRAQGRDPLARPPTASSSRRLSAGSTGPPTGLASKDQQQQQQQEASGARRVSPGGSQTSERPSSGSSGGSLTPRAQSPRGVPQRPGLQRPLESPSPRAKVREVSS